MTVTVITPAYNVADYIEEAVTSVLNQTMPGFRYLVVDDGSTDGTAEAAEAAANGDPRMRIIQQENQGSSAARNTGLELATTPYVAFIDGDDRWSPQMLSLLLTAMADAGLEVGAVFGHSRHIDEHGRPLGTALRRPAGIYDLSAMLGSMAPMGNGSCLLLRRSCFEEVGGFDNDLHSAVDLEMWLRIGKSSTSPLFLCVPEVVADYRIRSNSISTFPQPRFEALDRIFDDYGDDALPGDRARALVPTALNAYRSGFDRLGWKWMWSALRSAPTATVRHREFPRALPWMLLGGRATRRARRVRSAYHARHRRVNEAETVDGRLLRNARLGPPRPDGRSSAGLGSLDRSGAPPTSSGR